VLDTGYHWGLHPDLDLHVPQTSASQLPDVTPHDAVLDDQAAHGLFISGVIVRAAPTATIEIVKVLDGEGVGREGAIVAALARYRRRADVSVINMSLGTFGDPQFPPIGLALALASLPPTTAVVAAAGNNHTNQPMYPAAFSRAIGVAASADDAGTPASFSNYGPWVDCYAPGADVQGAFDDWSGAVPTVPQSTETFKGWATWTGTSFAAPKVAGAIAAKVGPTVSAQQAADALVHDPSRPILADYGRFLNL
jgi:subtilisin family serine protease